MSDKSPRIISLIASSTEIICALGAGGWLVGRSHECDFPESITSLPICSSPRFPTDGKSYQIDQRIKAILSEALSVYRVDAETLRELKPTHIVTQTQCEVCAVSPKDVEAALESYTETAPKIVSLHPNELADLWNDINRVAQSLGLTQAAQQLIAELQNRIEVVSRTAMQAENKPKVACIEWIEPLMGAGNWVPELVELAGGENLLGEAKKHSPQIEFSELVEKKPEIILVMPCGFNIKQSCDDFHLISERAGWDEIPAVKSNRVFIVDGNQYLNRPGPRLVDSLEILAELIHPELFPARYKDFGWQQKNR